MDRPQSTLPDEPAHYDAPGFASTVKEAVWRITPDATEQALLFLALQDHALKHIAAFDIVAQSEQDPMAEELVDYLIKEKREQVKPTMKRVFKGYFKRIFEALHPPTSPVPSPHDSPTPSPGQKRRRASLSPSHRHFPSNHWNEIAADHEDLWEFLSCLASLNSEQPTITCVCGKTIATEQGYNYYKHITSACGRGKKPALFVPAEEATRRQLRTRPSAAQLRNLVHLSPNTLQNLPSVIVAAIQEAPAPAPNDTTVTSVTQPDAPLLEAPVSGMELNDRHDAGNFPIGSLFCEPR